MLSVNIFINVTLNLPAIFGIIMKFMYIFSLSQMKCFPKLVGKRGGL